MCADRTAQDSISRGWAGTDLGYWIDALLFTASKSQDRDGNKPFRDELLSSERLEERALRAGGQFHDRPASAPPCARHVSALRRQRARAARRLPHAGRRRARRAVRHAGGRVAARQLPPDHGRDPRHPRSTCRGSYYRELPTLASREHAGQARVYAMAVELLRHSDSRLDRQQLTRFLNSYQRVAPLTIGELWAWPSMLKLALIENLRRLAEETARRARTRDAPPTRTSRELDAERQRARSLPPGRRTPRSSCSCCIACASTGPRCRRCAPRSRTHLAAQQTTAEDAVRAEHQRQAAARCRWPTPSPACACARRSTGASTSRRSAWSSSVLRRDPAGAYARMDFLSRDRQRQAVEELAPAQRRGAGPGRAERRSRARARRRTDGRPATARRTSATT